MWLRVREQSAMSANNALLHTYNRNEWAHWPQKISARPAGGSHLEFVQPQQMLFRVPVILSRKMQGLPYRKSNYDGTRSAGARELWKERRRRPFSLYILTKIFIWPSTAPIQKWKMAWDAADYPQYNMWKVIPGRWQLPRGGIRSSSCIISVVRPIRKIPTELQLLDHSHAHSAAVLLRACGFPRRAISSMMWWCPYGLSFFC